MDDVLEMGICNTKFVSGGIKLILVVLDSFASADIEVNADKYRNLFSKS